MSVRTLARRLGELGVSFARILDELRQDLAVRYLRDPDLGLSQIAFLLGLLRTQRLQPCLPAMDPDHAGRAADEAGRGARTSRLPAEPPGDGGHGRPPRRHIPIGDQPVAELALSNRFRGIGQPWLPAELFDRPRLAPLRAPRRKGHPRA